MADMEKVASAASRRSDLSRVYSAPHMDNQTAFYATSKEEDGRETDSVVPSYTARDDDNADLENGSGSSDGHDDDLQPAQSSRSRRSERDPKLVCIVLYKPPRQMLACIQADFPRSLGKDLMTPKIQRIGQ